MKKGIWLAFIMAILGVDILLSTGDIYAAEKKETIPGKTYDLGEKDAYDLSKISTESGSASRMYIEGDISEVTDKNGFVSYAVNSGNLKVKLDEKYGLELFNPTAAQNWHIATDKNKKVDNVTLSGSIGSGAIVVQTSKDGKIWITSETETDLYNKLDKINQRTINGEDVDAFYETTNVHPRKMKDVVPVMFRRKRFQAFFAGLRTVQHRADHTFPVTVHFWLLLFFQNSSQANSMPTLFFLISASYPALIFRTGSFFCIQKCKIFFGKLHFCGLKKASGTPILYFNSKTP